MKINKIILSLTICSFAAMASAQVAIGKNTVNGNDTLLDFDDSVSNYRGIILPAVDDASTMTLDGNNNGTFVLDKSDETVKYWTESQGWTPLSDEGDASAIPNNTSDETGEGVIIGAETSDANGVLVLESADKAMILPKVHRPHETVKSPYPGMICYDTDSKTLAVFDGLVWNYWK